MTSELGWFSHLTVSMCVYAVGTTIVKQSIQCLGQNGFIRDTSIHPVELFEKHDHHKNIQHSPGMSNDRHVKHLLLD